MKNKKELSIKQCTAIKAGVSARYIDYLLNGERDASVKTATKLERATGIDRTVWNFGSKAKRQSEWNRFSRAQNR